MSSGQASHVLAARLRALEHLPATGAVSLVVQLPVVKLFELDLVGDGEDAQIHLRTPVVYLLLDIWRYAVGAFVEDHERRSVVEQACKCDLLLLPGAEILLPIPRVIQLGTDDLSFLDKFKISSAVLAEDLGAAMCPPQTLQDLFVCPPLLLHGLTGVRVDDKVAQSSDRNEVDLSEEVDFFLRWHRDGPANQRPQLADDAK
mmetsp:Transcript_28065/g.63461  ORF Transcript_28065/g.63461 Transcript_28065/m.63461 type:complete len:202 (-) Transcript_28065:604-1209(-)